MVFIRNLVGGLLAELEDDINHDKFKRLLHYSRRLTSFQNRVKLVCTFSKPFPALKDMGCHNAQIGSGRIRGSLGTG